MGNVYKQFIKREFIYNYIKMYYRIPPYLRMGMEHYPIQNL